MKLVSLILFVFLASCAGRKTINVDESKVVKRGALSVSAEWIKDKGKKYDIRLIVENMHKGDIIVYLRDIRCFRGKTSGRLKHTFFNTGERTIDFREGEVKAFNLVCRLYNKTEGPFKIVINKVYENPEADGMTKGKVLAENIEWVMDSTD